MAYKNVVTLNGESESSIKHFKIWCKLFFSYFDCFKSTFSIYNLSNSFS